MARLRRNFIGGIVENDPLGSGDLTLTSAGLANLPAVSGTDYIPIVLDPDGINGAPEIVYISTHSAFSTSATLADDDGATPAREAKEGTVARAHPVGTYWIHAPTTEDFNANNPIDLPKVSTNPVDDDFFSSTLDGRWTLVDGASGTVNLLASSTAGIYDLSTSSGSLLVQVDNNGVSMRQDVTLGDGESIIASFSMSALADSSSAWSADEQQLRIVLNETDTAASDGTGVQIVAQALNDKVSVRFGSLISATNEGPEEPGIRLLGERFYLRISRSGSDYYGFYSGDGSTWLSLGYATPPDIPDNIWLDFLSSADAGTPVPVHACHWIRIGSNSLVPW